MVLKTILPDRPIPTRVLGGPFRGAAIIVNPRNSLRKIFGVYEHELNHWLKRVLPHIRRALDVGACDGYFTFGCAAALRRFGKEGEIIAFEPLQEFVDTLRDSAASQPCGTPQVTVVQTMVGSQERPGVTTLDAVQWRVGDPTSRTHTLVKIDVEGAEVEVLKGALSWLDPTNYFVIEVHEEAFLDSIPRLFAARGLRLTRVDQQPLPVLGREMRGEKNWWLVSDLSGLPSAG